MKGFNEILLDAVENKVGMSAIYQAPNNAPPNLKKFHNKKCKVSSVEGGTYTIKFANGKMLTEVPLENLRFIK